MVPVVLSSSNEYVPFLYIAVLSIINNSSTSINYEIIILENNISRKNKKLLYSLICKKINFSIRFISCQKFINNKNLYTSSHVTINTYLRLAVLDILDNYDKVIYLDCDIIVNKDLAILFETDIEEYFIAAVIDTVMSSWCNDTESDQKKYNKEILKLQRDFEYFNAGVLVLNLKKIRTQYNTSQLFEIATAYKWRWFDQDVLNMVCEGNVRFLDNKWNVICHLEKINFPELKAPDYIREKYKNAVQNPYIIHYAGRVLPCYCPKVRNADFFWKYAKTSPFYSYFILKYLFSLITIFFLPYDSKRRELIKKCFYHFKI